ncbi:MAG: hypothetical protein RLY86_3607 [Pseudomonadota bacterium]|jgi:predicted ATPase
MLTRIELKTFKCFADQALPLTPLTLLSGTNASGKSSILQALALLHQTMREHEWSRRLMLNGTVLRLGTVLDVVDKVNGRRGFEILLEHDEVTYHWAFEGEKEHLSLALTQVAVSGCEPVPQDRVPITLLRHLLPVNADGGMAAPDEGGGALPVARILRNLHYITAERVGPRETYPLVDPAIGAVVGPTGEFTAGLLHLKKEERVAETLILTGETPTLLGQVKLRMQQFFPGSDLQVTPIPAANAVSLGLRTSPETDFHRPMHVGFGLTQILPILVACLSARPGDLILIENPEVHLHPFGQAMMGQFLAQVAQAGVQVIMETHSDHVLNGVRRAVKAGMKPEAVTLYFLRPRQADRTQMVSPRLDADGNVDHWPDGFFDQFDKDMNHFAGWD